MPLVCPLACALGSVVIPMSRLAVEGTTGPEQENPFVFARAAAEIRIDRRAAGAIRLGMLIK